MLDVFLIDDEYYERLSLKQNIPWSKYGMRVVGEASNGNVAFQMICELQPHIAIVDINMPGLNGLALISKLNETNLDCQYIILTGYDDFRFAQTAIGLSVSNYILKPINYNTLTETLEKLKNKITEQANLSTKINTLKTENELFYLEHYYNDLVNCNFNLQSIHQEDNNLAQKVILHYTAFQVAVLDFATPLPRKTLRHLQRLIYAKNPNTHHTCCLDNKNRFFFLLNTSSSFDVHIQLEHIMQYFAPQYELYIGIGKSYTQFEQLYLSYNEACMALQSNSILQKNIIFFDELSESAPFSTLDSSSKNQLRTYIFNHNLTDLTTLLTTIYEELILTKSPWNSVILRSIELVNFLTEILSAQANTAISFLEMNENILDKLNRMKTIEDIQSWLIQTYINAIQNTAKIQTKYSSATIGVETYIQEHFSDSTLTITDIAKNLYLNYRYICHCFKRDKKITINDYVNQVRIEHAIKLFKRDINNISYVSEKCGFSSASYFSKQFKRSTGLAPKEFIKTL